MILLFTCIALDSLLVSGNGHQIFDIWTLVCEQHLCLSFQISDYYLFSIPAGSTLSDQVHQSPADIHHQPGAKAKINCSHTIQNYNQILWYKKSSLELQLLGYMYVNNPNLEKGIGVTIEGDASKDKTCTLIIEGLSLNSSAVYFCAASLHTATQHWSSVQESTHHLCTREKNTLRSGDSGSQQMVSSVEQRVTCVTHRLYRAQRIQKYDKISVPQINKEPVKRIFR